MQEKREEWKKFQSKLDILKLKFLDESSVNCGMTRLYGRALSSERVYDYVPDVRFERTSIIMTMGLNGINAPMMFKGTLDGELFSGWVEYFLAPTLSPGDIVVLDNCSTHKANGVLNSIYEVGTSVIFLPPYSPDFNPIELMFSKLKTILRKLKPRNSDQLFEAMKQGLDSVTYENIVGWFSRCGYLVNL